MFDRRRVHAQGVRPRVEGHRRARNADYVRERAYIPKIRDVGDARRPVGEKGRRHEGERGIFGSADGERAIEGRTAIYDELVHNRRKNVIKGATRATNNLWRPVLDERNLKCTRGGIVRGCGRPPNGSVVA
jgi:hypothetical protein